MEAADSQTPEFEAALESVCQNYWYPLYAFARRSGKDPEAAADLTQGFFEKLLEKKYLKSADRERGRFRTFLLTAFRHFAADEWNKSQRVKRGGRATFIAIDNREAEDRFTLEPATDETPERIFERKWADSFVDKVLQKLREEMTAENGGDRFEAFKEFLTGGGSEATYAEAGARISLSENAARSAIHRMRKRFAALFRSEVAEMVAGPQQVDDEISWILDALS